VRRLARRCAAARARAAHRLRERGRGIREQLGGRRHRLERERIRAAAARCVPLDVEQPEQEQRAADPVDRGVMDFHNEREAAALQALDHPHLPERVVAAQRHLGDPRDQFEQLALAAGRGQRRAVQVRVEVEVRVVGPHGVADPERHADELAPQEWQRRQPPLDLRADPAKILARPAPARLDHERAHHAAAHRLCGVEKRGVHAAERPQPRFP
jgi:hypothetical protein